jgi:hypothetical protein
MRICQPINSPMDDRTLSLTRKKKEQLVTLPYLEHLGETFANKLT